VTIDAQPRQGYLLLADISGCTACLTSQSSSTPTRSSADSHHRSSLNSFDGFDYLLDQWKQVFHPVGGSPYHNDADTGFAEILLELDSLIGGHNHFESFPPRETDQFAVGPASPALRMDGDDLVVPEMTRELAWE
jgi:hypothetical protein